MDLPDSEVATLVRQIKYQLLTRMGRSAEEASHLELYLALAYALREEVMRHWTATSRSVAHAKARVTYYLSMEYLPGPMTLSNAKALGAEELVRAALQRLGRQYHEIISLEPDPGLGNGGLGRLASCLLEGAATHHFPIKGYGLRYQYGIFEQQVWQGVQVERPDMWLAHEYPWEFRHDTRAVSVRFGGRPVAKENVIGEMTDDLIDYDEVRAVPHDIPIVGYPLHDSLFINTLRLWSTRESPRNFQLQSYNAGQLDQAAEQMLLTDVLYPQDAHDIGKRIRLKQEFLLVSASLQDIFRSFFYTYESLSDFPEKVRIQINDTHPALCIAELLRLLTKSYSVPWNEAVDWVTTCCGYTNHSLLKEALEEWDASWFRQLLPRQMNLIEHLNLDLCTKMRRSFPGDEQGVQAISIVENQRVRMANLAIAGSHRTNGVAPLHTSLLESHLFPEFVRLFPERFCNITNGVSPRRWVLSANPPLSNFLTEHLSSEWVTNWSRVAQLRQYAEDRNVLDALAKVKHRNKEAFAVWMMSHGQMRDARGHALQRGASINPNALFDMQVKRIHEYKRQMLSALWLIHRILEIQEQPNEPGIPRVFFYAGKAAPGYRQAKAVLQLITALADMTANDPILSERLRIIFLEGYDVSLAEQLIPAADLSEQIPCPGYEASGTGNMKFAMNGALTIASRDGANLDLQESIGSTWWPFGFGSTVEALAHRPFISSHEILRSQPFLQRALEALKMGVFARYDAEKAIFQDLYRSLVDPLPGEPSDPYAVLADFQEYTEAQKRVDALYADPMTWHRIALMNIAGTGPFSIDRTVVDYAREIWGTTPVDIDPELLREVASGWSEAARDSTERHQH